MATVMNALDYKPGLVWYDKEKVPYLPSETLVNVVNLALRIQRRPLLLKGEPGCGKTRLAEAVAHQLGMECEFWSVKSTSRAKDGLYTFDAIRRLQDAQLARNDKRRIEAVEKPITYVKWGELGRALQSSKQRIVLIDEIDKADVDFPNDLLLELDRQWFKVDEASTRERDYIVPEDRRLAAKPIVFITSNDEKPLPAAFLRRCLFYYIPFPDATQLGRILRAHFVGRNLDGLITEAVKRFLALRQEMDTNNEQKKVSTSEAIDWVEGLSENPKASIAALQKNELPMENALLKSEQDIERYGSGKKR